MIEQHKHEAVIYYNSNNAIDKEILAYAESHFNHIRKIDVTREKITGTRFEQIAMQIGLPLIGLIRSRMVTPRGDIYPPDLRVDDDRIKFLQHNPEFIRTPIVITNREAAVVTRVFELYDMVKDGGKILV